MALITFVLLTSAAAVAWAYILLGHGQSWRTDQRLPPAGPEPQARPAITIVIPARDEATMLPLTLPTLLEQDYSGKLRIVLVDDQSSDDTAAIATELGKAAGWTVSHASASHAAASLPGVSCPPVSHQAVRAARASGNDRHDRELPVIAGQPLPDGWAGKVWAMSQGLAASGPSAQGPAASDPAASDPAATGDPAYILFTDADIAYNQGTIAKLANAATANDLALVSQMALLRARTSWERMLIPAFVYFFAQLYPFRLVNRQASRTAAAAGGCMLVSRAALAQAGGLTQIRKARIDDVALGTLLKRAGASCWLGLSTDVASVRDYPALSEIWDMVARSAYTQLRYSMLTLIAVIAGLTWLYLLPPAAVIAGLAALAAGAGPTAGWLLAVGTVGWAIMSVSYLPILRLYRLSPLRALTLPVIAALYAAMTADSARRHLAGHGGAWKGRTINR